MNTLFVVILVVLSGSYAYGSDSTEPTEDKENAWFSKNYGFMIFTGDPDKTDENIKPTVLLHHECSKKNPSSRKMTQYIQNGALLNAVVNRFDGKPMPRGRPNYGVPLGSHLETAIRHTDDAHVVNVCKLLIDAKADPTKCDNLECPPVHSIIKRFESSSQTPTALVACKTLIELSQANEFVFGTRNRAVDYALQEIQYHSINSKSLLPFLEAEAQKQPTQKSRNMLQLFQPQASKPAPPATNTVEKTYIFSDAPESEEPETQSAPNPTSTCTIL